MKFVLFTQADKVDFVFFFFWNRRGIFEARRNEAGFIEKQKKNSNVPRRDVVPRIIHIQNVKVLQ